MNPNNETRTPTAIQVSARDRVTTAIARLDCAVDAAYAALHDLRAVVGSDHDAYRTLSETHRGLLTARAKLVIVQRRTPA